MTKEATRRIILANWIDRLDEMLEEEAREFGFTYRKIGPDGHGYLFEITGKSKNLDSWSSYTGLEWEQD